MRKWPREEVKADEGARPRVEAVLVGSDVSTWCEQSLDEGEAKWSRNRGFEESTEDFGCCCTLAPTEAKQDRKPHTVQTIATSSK